MSPLAPLFKVAFHQRRASRFARPPRVRRRRPPKLLELLAHNPSAYRPQRTRPKYASTLVLIRTISVARRDRRRRRTTNQQARHAPQLRKLRLEVLRVREHRGEDPVQFVGPRRRLLRAILVTVRAFRVLLQPRVLSGRFAQPRRGLGFAVHGQAKAVAERRVLGLGAGFAGGWSFVDAGGGGGGGGDLAQSAPGVVRRSLASRIAVSNLRRGPILMPISLRSASSRSKNVVSSTASSRSRLSRSLKPAFASSRVMASGIVSRGSRRRRVGSNTLSLDSYLNHFAEPWRPRLV